MVLECELLVIILAQIAISVVESRKMGDIKAGKMNWLLAIASNGFHSYMNIALLGSDLDSDDRNLFMRLLIGFVMLIISEICYLVIQVNLWKLKVFPIVFSVLEIYLIGNIFLTDDFIMMFIVFEVNFFALFIDFMKRKKHRRREQV